jgi:hypothetical protein
MRSSSGRSGSGLRGCLLLAVVGASFALTSAASAAAPRRRLELAGGVYDDAVPIAVDGEESLWRSWDGAEADGHEIAAPTRQVVGWGLWPPLPQGPIVILADGGLIAGRIEAADDASVRVRSPSLGRLVLPAASVAGWRAGTSLGPGPLHVGVSNRDTAACVLLENADVLAAGKATWRDGRLNLPVRTGGVTVPEGVVRAIDFGRSGPLREAAGARLQILAALADGSWFEIESLRSASAGGPAGLADAEARLAIVPAAGLASQVAECFATDLVALAVDGGAATRLGLREPVAFAQTPLRFETSPAWPLGRNRTVTGGWPTLRGETASGAIGMHAPATARFAVPARGSRFEGRVGIDDTAGAGGSVVVRVRTSEDGDAGRDAFVSPVVRGGDRPLDVRVDLGPATSVELVVEPADGGAVLDRVLWLDPRVVVPDGS